MKREQIIEILTSLGFECQPSNSLEVNVTVPYWRMDIMGTADLVEELARIVGYDRIPATMLTGQLPGQHVDPVVTLREKLRDLMVGCGFQEVISYSLVSQQRLGTAIPMERTLRVANPLSVEQEYLRTSLRPSLLTLLRSNQRYEEGGIKLFEIGKVYLPRQRDLPEERETLAGVISGTRGGLSWLGEKGWLDFFDAKGALDALLGALGIEADFRAVSREGLHPGRAAEIVVGDEVVGVIGEVHPGVAESLELLSQPVALFEFDIEKLVPRMTSGAKYRPLSRFPESVRDIALVLDMGIPAKRVKDIISSYPLVVRVALFDVYVGEQIPRGKKSLAFRVAYQSPAHTLSDEKVEAVEKEILAKLSQELGASLRG